MSDGGERGDARPGTLGPAPAGSDALASIAQRALAQVIDSLLVLAPVIVVVLVFDIDPLAGQDGGESGGLLAVTALWLAIGIVYETVAIAVFARTVGKRVLGLKVVRSEDGGRVGWTYASVRALVPAAAGLVPYIGLGLQVAVYLRAAFHPLRQGWHDAATGTLVVLTR